MPLFKFQIIYNNQVYQGNSIDAIANRIISDFPDEKFSDVVQYIDREIIPVAKRPQQAFPPEARPKSKVTIRDIRAGATSVMRQIGGDTVSQEEIENRSRICNVCPKISNTTVCLPCGGGKALASFVNGIKNLFGGGYKIPKDLENNYCSVCECSLAMMLPAPKAHFLQSTITDPKRPATCWMKKS